MGNIVRHYSMGRTRKELADYVLNCTEDELCDLCSYIGEHIQGIITWSCEECKKRFNPNCEYQDSLELCKKHFSEMNQPFASNEN